MNAISISTDGFKFGFPEKNLTAIEIDISIHGTENTKYIIEQFNMDVLGLGINDIQKGDRCVLTTK